MWDIVLFTFIHLVPPPPQKEQPKPTLIMHYQWLSLCCTFADHRNNPHRLCMAVYYLPKNFQPQPVPHGNSRDNKPYFSTLPSTMAVIKNESKHSGPKQVIQRISSSMGGILSATDMCQLPRSEQQVS